jgi:ligand-binding sensor domain-containing protein
MSDNNYQQDLPVLRTEDHDLPLLLADVSIHEKPVENPDYSKWYNLVSQRDVRGLAPNPNTGDLWVATWGGVLRWWPDQKCFTRYMSEHGLPGNAMRDVAVDKANQVWGSPEAGGLLFLEDNVWRPYSFIRDAFVHCLTSDGTTGLWVVTSREILHVITPHDAPVHRIPLPPGGSVRDLSVTDDRTLWLCNARGVFQYDGHTWQERYRKPTILKLVCTGSLLWLGTHQELVRVDLATSNLQAIQHCPPTRVTALTPAAGTIWAACGNQVGFVVENTWKPVHTLPFTTQVTELTPIFPKKATNPHLWVGTGRGLLYSDPEGIEFHLTNDSPDVIGELPTDISQSTTTLSTLIQALALQRQEQRAVLWIGTPCGLFRFDTSTETWRHYRRSDLQNVRGLLTSEDTSRILLASLDGGLHTLEKRRIKEHIKDVPAPVLALGRGISGVYWAASLTGLYRETNGNWALCLPSEQLPEGAWIQAIHQYNTHQVILGTSLGLFVYDTFTKELKNVRTVPGFADIRAISSSPDDQQNATCLWIGANRGLWVGPLDNLEYLTDIDGYTINTLLWDEASGIVWVGTNRGLFEIMRDQGAWCVKEHWTIRNSGLAADNVTALMLDVQQHKEKNLWIGTTGGLCRYAC